MAHQETKSAADDCSRRLVSHVKGTRLVLGVLLVTTFALSLRQTSVPVFDVFHRYQFYQGRPSDPTFILRNHSDLEATGATHSAIHFRPMPRLPVLRGSNEDGGDESRSGEISGAQVETQHAELLSHVIPRNLSVVQHARAVRKLKEQLNRNYDVPCLLLDAISEPMLSRLARQLHAAKIGAVQTTGGVSFVPKLMVVHPQNGLGNRIRVFGSALTVARRYEEYGRILVVVWEQDIHMQADFFDLYQDINDIVVIDNTLAERWPMRTARNSDPAWKSFDLYNYMDQEPESARHRTVEDNMNKHVYYRGCEIMIVGHRNLDMLSFSSKAMRALEPAPEILETIQNIEEAHGPLSQKIGVHVRSKDITKEFSSGFDASKEYSKESFQKMQEGRAKSSLKTFVTEMRVQERDYPNVEFYVATDSPSIYPELNRLFPGRIVHLPQFHLDQCDNKRNVFCSRLAMVDLLALRKTGLFLGSSMSSFTQMVMKLGVRRFRRVGIEFAT